MIVLDASATIEWILNTPVGERVGRHVAVSGESLHAPRLLDVETLVVLRRLCANRTLTEPRARVALADLADLPITRYSHELLIGRVWSLRATLSAHDAIYVALAEALAATVVTCDGRLGRSHGHEIPIDVVT